MNRANLYFFSAIRVLDSLLTALFFSVFVQLASNEPRPRARGGGFAHVTRRCPQQPCGCPR